METGPSTSLIHRYYQTDDRAAVVSSPLHCPVYGRLPVYAPLFLLGFFGETGGGLQIEHISARFGYKAGERYNHSKTIMIMDTADQDTVQAPVTADRPLSRRKNRHARYIVYPLMFLLFGRIRYLIFRRWRKERAAEEKEGIQYGYSLPGQQGWTATRWTLMSVKNWRKKDKYRKNAFQEMKLRCSAVPVKDTVHLPEGMAELPVEGADNPSTGSHNTMFHSSAGAYHQRYEPYAGSIYEPRTDPEKEKASGKD